MWLFRTEIFASPPGRQSGSSRCLTMEGVVMVILLAGIVCQEHPCYHEDPYEPYYTTETVYAKGKMLLQARLSREDHRVKGCNAEHLQLFVRHPTRYASAKHMKMAVKILYPLRDNITFNFKDGKTKVCAEDLKWLRNWKLTYNESKAKLVADRGEKEIKAIAKTYNTYFQDLLKYSSNKDYKFIHTNTMRTKMSAKIFAMTLFGHNIVESIKFKNTGKNNPLLRPYRSCLGWIQDILNNPLAYKEIEKFKKSKVFLDMISGISERFGFPEPLPLDTVLLIHIMCRFEYGVNDGSAPWCAAFTRKDIQVLEYFYDLEYWWLHGYGFPINYEQNCSIMKKIIRYLEMAAKPNGSNPTVPRAVFSFSHSKFMLRLFAMLGFFKDGNDANYKMRAEDFGKDHKWRLSAIDPVATNLGIVLYKCKSGEHKLKMFVQEKPIEIPGCLNKVCGLNEFLKKYKHIAEKCNFSAVCTPGWSELSSGSNHDQDISNGYLGVHHIFEMHLITITLILMNDVLK